MTVLSQIGNGLMYTVYAVFSIVGPEDQTGVTNYPNTSYKAQNYPTRQSSLPSQVNKPIIPPDIFINKPEIIETPKIIRYNTRKSDIIENVPKYPPPEETKGKSQIFRIALIGGSFGTLEQGNVKISYLKMGKLIYTKQPNRNQKIVQITWDLQEHEKGMKLKLEETGEINTDSELSEIFYYCGYLTTMSRSSSQFYRFTTDDTFRLKKWIAVSTGTTGRSVQLEWATVITDYANTTKLYVGSTGANDKSTRGFSILCSGGVLNANTDYLAIMKACSVSPVVGYVTNTTSLWSNKLKRNLFIPRKVSKERYNSIDDIKKGSNIIVSTDVTLENAKLEKKIGVENPELGYTSAKFLPNNNEEIIVALQNSEVSNDSYITVFNFNTGEIIYPSTLVSTTEHMLYSGLVFISI